jgi:hypothetical protein
MKSSFGAQPDASKGFRLKKISGLAWRACSKDATKLKHLGNTLPRSQADEFDFDTPTCQHSMIRR